MREARRPSEGGVVCGGGRFGSEDGANRLVVGRKVERVGCGAAAET